LCATPILKITREQNARHFATVFAIAGDGDDSLVTRALHQRLSAILVRSSDDAVTLLNADSVDLHANFGGNRRDSPQPGLRFGKSAICGLDAAVSAWPAVEPAQSGASSKAKSISMFLRSMAELRFG
jgi:hypothetical protein